MKSVSDLQTIPVRIEKTLAEKCCRSCNHWVGHCQVDHRLDRNHFNELFTGLFNTIETASEERTDYHGKTIELLNLAPRRLPTGRQALDRIERTIGQQLPASVREWYELEEALELIARYSNADYPVPIEEMSLKTGGESLPDLGKSNFMVFKRENQGVCAWAILLDGNADPPVFLDFDSGFSSPVKCCDSFSDYLYACIWDYSQVLASDSLLLQAQNGPLSYAALKFLSQNFDQGCVTDGWPGEKQYRFSRGNQRVLIWANREQADWWLHAKSAGDLESLVRILGPVDSVGNVLWSNDAQGELVLRHRNKSTG